jgi:hypothetical protein
LRVWTHTFPIESIQLCSPPLAPFQHIPREDPRNCLASLLLNLPLESFIVRVEWMTYAVVQSPMKASAVRPVLAIRLLIMESEKLG